MSTSLPSSSSIYTTTPSLTCIDYNSITSYVTNTKLLLALERTAELNESLLYKNNLSEKYLESIGIYIRYLIINEIKTGLYNRILIEFIRKDNNILIDNEISNGDIIQIGLENNSVTGIVYKKTTSSITISFDEYPDDIIEPCSILKLSNQVTYQRYNKALDILLKCDIPLKDICFGTKEPEFNDKFIFEPYNKNLNSSQLDAVAFAMKAKNLALIHGPPGTGKTTTLIEIILQSIKLGQKVLACAASNIAIDNIAEKLTFCKVKMCRLGHPTRLLPSVVEHSLDALVRNHDNTALVEDAKKELSDIFKKLKNTKDKGERNALKNEIRPLRKEINERESKTVDQILKNSQVILCTLTGAGLREIQGEFDLVVIDEAAQALEVACWIPLQYAKKCVLAGDHLQLPPTIKSFEAQKDLELTLFQRMIDKFQAPGSEKVDENNSGEDSFIVKMLVDQYRMHELIMKYPSYSLYKNKLVAGPDVKTHRLCDLPSVIRTSDTVYPVIFIDTMGLNIRERAEDNQASKSNEGEAEIVMRHIRRLLAAGVTQENIAIISPYHAQVHILRRLTTDENLLKIEVGTVDGFQGREAEVILLSLVRSNDNKIVGFLEDVRRMNVACTRARRQLCVVGDGETLEAEKKWLSGWMKYCNVAGEYRSAQEYLSDNSLIKGGLPITEEIDDFDIDLNTDLSKLSLENKSDAKNVAKSRLVKKENKKPINKNQNKNASNKNETSKSSSSSSKDEFIHETDRVQFSEFIDAVLSVLLSGFSDINAWNKSLKKYPDEFLNCKPFLMNDRLEFPPSLNSFQRLIVHEVSERLSLSHESKTVGDNRIITVLSKKGAQKSTPNPLIMSDTESKQIKMSSSIFLDKEIEEFSQSESESEEDEKKEVAFKKPLKSSKNTPNVDEEDFDAVLSGFNRNMCSLPSCNKKTELVGLDCTHCRRRFCFAHGIPEGHGCDLRAKNAARSNLLPPLPPKKVSSTKRDAMVNKLDSKIKKKEEERSKKTKKK